MRRSPIIIWQFVCPALMLGFMGAGAAAQDSQAPLFKSGVSRVAVTAVVRDTRGKLIRNLGPDDFELFDAGERRPILSVWSEPSPASVAILMDVSGSMATKLGRARQTAQAFVAGLKPGVDEAAYYTFDTQLKEVRPFSTTFETADHAWQGTRAYGATSLWDAIAATAQQIAERQRRRALVVITDGVDSASRLTPAEVSAIASSVDVPVYMLVIAFGGPDPAREAAAVRGPLADLAAWTGGDAFRVTDAETAASVAAKVLAELQLHYVIAFEPGSARGWHPLVLRARKPGLFVRTRTGYMVK